MNSQQGISLFHDISAALHDAIADSPLNRRVSILSHFLAAFASSGANIRELFGHSDDVDAALQSLGHGPNTHNPPFDEFSLTIDLSQIDRPSSYDFVNGPFDGSSFRLGTGIHEQPPETITLQPDPTSSRGHESEKYRFQAMRSYDADGQPIDETVAYYYVPSQESQ